MRFSDTDPVLYEPGFKGGRHRAGVQVGICALGLRRYTCTAGYKISTNVEAAIL